MKSLPLLSLFFLGWGTAVAAENPSSVAELFGTPDNLRIVRQADKVDACLLRHLPPSTLPNGRIDWKTERYEETAFVPVPPSPAKVLQDLVLNDKTFAWSDHGGHRPQLYLRLRFHRGETAITLDFCFICQVVVVTCKGEPVGHASFAPNSDLLVQAFLQVFPRDAPLRQLAREAGLPP